MPDKPETPFDPMMLDPRLRPVKMTLEQAQSEISNAIYKASDLFERLEATGLVRGNGHHIRQQLALHASDLMKERWTNEAEKGS